MATIIKQLGGVRRQCAEAVCGGRIFQIHFRKAVVGYLPIFSVSVRRPFFPPQTWLFATESPCIELP